MITSNAEQARGFIWDFKQHDTSVTNDFFGLAF